MSDTPAPATPAEIPTPAPTEPAAPETITAADVATLEVPAPVPEAAPPAPPAPPKRPEGERRLAACQTFFKLTEAAGRVKQPEGMWLHIDVGNGPQLARVLFLTRDGVEIQIHGGEAHTLDFTNINVEALALADAPPG